MFNIKLSILTTCILIGCVQLKPYWGMQQGGYPNYFYPYPPPAPYYPMYTPQYPYVSQNYPYGVNQGLNNNPYQQRSTRYPTQNSANPVANTITSAEIIDENDLPSSVSKTQINPMQQYANSFPYPTYGLQQHYTDVVINQEDLPNFMARIQGRPLPNPTEPQQQQHQQHLQLHEAEIREPWTPKINEPIKHTEVKYYSSGPHINSNSYVDRTPKKVTVIRSFPYDGSKPKIQIISDMSTRQTPTGTIILNELNNDKNDDDANEEIDESNEIKENHLDENAIVTEHNSNEDESHPKPILHWPF